MVDFMSISFNKTGLDYEDWNKLILEKYAENLKETQNILSTTQYDFTSNNAEQINPSNILVYYNEI